MGAGGYTHVSRETHTHVVLHPMVQGVHTHVKGDTHTNCVAHKGLGVAHTCKGVPMGARGGTDV